MKETEILIINKIDNISILTIETDNDDLPILEFISLFNCTILENIINFPAIQQVTPQLIKNVNEFVKKYKEKSASLYRLKKIIDGMSINEYFCIMPNINSLTLDQQFSVINKLNSLNDGNHKYNETKDFFNEIFSNIISTYNIFTHPDNKKYKIGEPLVGKRKCRFCGKMKSDGITFSNEAHAISEALGNKKIIINEECDSCNTKFDRGIERDIIYFLQFFLTLWGVKNKNNKFPKIKGQNFTFEHKDKNGLTYSEKNEDGKIDKDSTKRMNLKFNEKISLQNIYRALCKFAISIIEQYPGTDFSNTIKWINGDYSFKKLPKIGIFNNYNLLFKEPKMTVYIRKNNNNELPFAVGEFLIMNFIFVFIIPTFEEYDKRFIEKVEYEKYFVFFKNWNKIEGWNFQDFSDEEKRELWIEFN